MRNKKPSVLSYLSTSPGGDMRRVYVEGMTCDEASRAMRSDPEYIKRKDPRPNKMRKSSIKEAGGPVLETIVDVDEEGD